MYCVVEEKQRDKVYQVVWLTIFQARRNKPEETKKEIIVNKDIATATLNNQQYYNFINGYVCLLSTIPKMMSAPSLLQTKHE